MNLAEVVGITAQSASWKRWFVFLADKVLFALLLAVFAGLIVFWVQHMVQSEELARQAADAMQAKVADDIAVFTDEICDAALTLKHALDENDSDLLRDGYYQERDAVQRLMFKQEMNSRAYASYEDDIATCANAINSLSESLRVLQQSNMQNHALNADTFMKDQQEFIEACMLLSNKNSEMRFGVQG